CSPPRCGSRPSRTSWKSSASCATSTGAGSTFPSTGLHASAIGLIHFDPRGFVPRTTVYTPGQMKPLSLFAAALGLVALASAQDAPFLTSELVFPLEHWHNH